MSTTRFRPAASAEENSLPASPRVRDTRSFWRLLLAFVAPIPMAFMGVVYLIRPWKAVPPSPTRSPAWKPTANCST
jgi:hypothetical protein